METDRSDSLPKAKRLVDLKFVFQQPTTQANRPVFTTARKNRPKHASQNFFTLQKPKINRRISNQFRVPNLIKKSIDFTAVSQNDIRNTKQTENYLRVVTERKAKVEITNLTDSKSSKRFKSCINHFKNNDVQDTNVFSEEITEIIDDHQKSIEMLREIDLKNINNVNPEFKTLMRENLHLTSKIIKLSSNLLQNNLTLFSALSNSGSVDKVSVNNINNNSSSTVCVTAKPLPFSTAKKSQMMYASMKSHMNFLNTPKPIDNSVNTPNTKSRLIISHNVKRQLEKIFDT